MTAVWFVIAGLATFRLTRLVVGDYLTARPRRWVQTHAGPSVAYLAGCPWCASVYIGAGVAYAVTWWPDNRVVQAALYAAALSAVTGLIATWADPGEDHGVPFDPADES